MKDIELLHYIHKTAEMGIEGLVNVEKQIKGEALRRAVDQQEEEYRDISRASGELLRSRGEDPKDPGVMARVSSEFMSVMQTMADSSDSKIAEMVIQGNNMGVTKSVKHLHDYEGDDPKVRALAEKLLKTEQANVEQMQGFL